MFKFIGLLGLMCSMGMLGMIKSSELKARTQLLEDFLQMMLGIKSHINYMREPLLVILEKESKINDSKAFCFFDKVRHDLTEKEAEIGQIWAQNADLIYKDTSLTADDLNLMKYAGTFIGQSDYENQLAQFQYFEERISAQIEESKLAYSQKGPLYRKLGFFAGGLAAIILI